MSLLNLLISSALSVSPDELSAVQKAANNQERHRDSASGSSTSQPQESESSSSANASEDNKEAKGSSSEVPVYRPSEGESGRGERGGEGLPSYGAVEETTKPPGYEESRGSSN